MAYTFTLDRGCARSVKVAEVNKYCIFSLVVSSSKYVILQQRNCDQFWLKFVNYRSVSLQSFLSGLTEEEAPTLAFHMSSLP